MLPSGISYWTERKPEETAKSTCLEFRISPSANSIRSSAIIVFSQLLNLWPAWIDSKQPRMEPIDFARQISLKRIKSTLSRSTELRGKP
jgi:hypothetical protein